MIGLLLAACSPKAPDAGLSTSPSASPAKEPQDIDLPPVSDKPLKLTVATAVDCESERLGASSVEICASPSLLQLNKDIDRLTFELEQILTGADKAALVDTAGPFLRQRNNCVNERPAVRACVERVLGDRMTGLQDALRSGPSIHNEITKYAFLSPEFFKTYGERLVGKRIHVFGCMTLEPGPTPASRTQGFISPGCAKTEGPPVPVIFNSMNENTVNFFESKTPSTHWEGTVERRDGRLVLAQMEP
jgi:uncharacterized protein